jgi:hypothetical protein
LQGGEGVISRGNAGARDDREGVTEFISESRSD